MNVFTVKTENGYTKWELSPECEREVGPIADQFGMGIKRFLYLYSTEGLPGQLPRENPVEQEKAPQGFGVSACADPAVWDRVKRAAKADGLSIKDFVWKAVASFVDVAEEEMILNPRTGATIANRSTLLCPFLVASERHEI